MATCPIESCIIGLLNNKDDEPKLVTIGALKLHVNYKTEEANYLKEKGERVSYVYTMTDYYNRRKQTDLQRFLFCPICGRQITWSWF